MKRLHAILCVFCLLCAVWLAVMESSAKHPGYQLQLVTTAIIAAQSAAAGTGIGKLRWSLVPGAILIFIIGANAVARGTEGFSGVIGLACTMQALLTVFIVAAATGAPPRHQPADPSRQT